MIILTQLKSATHQKTSSHTHKIDTTTETNRQVMKRRKEIQSTGTTTKPQTHINPKGRRNHMKTGTKGAQTTGNRMEESTEEIEQWNI